MEGTLTSKGQITVPSEIRTQLNLKKGDRLEFEIEGGTIKMSPKTVSLDDLINTLPRSERSFTVEEMNEAIAKAACDGGH